MRSIFSQILKPYYVPLEKVNVDDTVVAANPNPKLTKYLVNNIDRITLPFGNSHINEGLVVHFIDHFKIIAPEEIVVNTDPRAAETIIEIVSRKNGKLKPYNIRNNSNPGLTQFLINSHVDVSGNPNPALTKTIIERNYKAELSSNTNPELTEYIISLGVNDELFSNPNPGLTKFIMEKYENKYYPYLVKNTNHLLAEFIISKLDKLDEVEDCTEIITNPNPGLTELIRKGQYSRRYIELLGKNTNPELLDYILNYMEDRFMENSVLSVNPNIVKRKLISLL